MKKSKSVGDRLKAITLQSDLNKQQNVEKPKDNAETNFEEEYSKLRKPKPATLLKIQARQKKSDNIAVSQTKADAGIEEEKNLQVPLRQEFLSKKEQLEKATSNLLKKYEMRKSPGRLLDDDLFSQDSDEAQPLTLNKELDLNFKELNLKCQATNGNTSNIFKDCVKSLNYLEQHLVNILYIKVQAHSNGFFASNLPYWYTKTFDKELPSGWLELLEKSHKFYIEKVQSKTVLYAKESNEDHIDLKASGDKAANTTMKKTNTDMHTESSVRFVRYKHLQKSLQKYSLNAGRDMPYATKSNENFIKPRNGLNKAAKKEKI